MKYIIRWPIINSIITSLVLSLLTQGYIRLIKLPGLEFSEPENIADNVFVFYITDKSENYDYVRINLEFYEGCIYQANAFKLDTSKNIRELKVSNHKNDFISWDSLKDPYLGESKIQLYPTEKIKILITFNRKISEVPIRNICIFHSKEKEFLSLRNYQSIIRLRRIIWGFFILIILLILPYAKVLETFQRRFLKKCYLDDKKSLTKFTKKFYHIIYNEIDKYCKYLDDKEKTYFYLVIVNRYILPRWQELPKFYRSLDRSFKKDTESFCVEYLIMKFI